MLHVQQATIQQNQQSAGMKKDPKISLSYKTMYYSTILLKYSITVLSTVVHYLWVLRSRIVLYVIPILRNNITFSNDIIL